MTLDQHVIAIVFPTGVSNGIPFPIHPLRRDLKVLAVEDMNVIASEAYCEIVIHLKKLHPVDER